MNAAAYYRASTSQELQNNSLEIQKRICENFALTNGYEISATFSEYESGGNDDRAEFNRALEYAINNDCVLICARVDRASRSLSIFSRIQDHLSRLRFADLGNVEPSLVLLSVLISLGAQERINASIRVKACFETLRAKDANHPWGNPNININCRPIGLKVRKANAAAFNTKIQGICADLKKAGYLTLDKMAARLNEMNISSRRGKAFNKATLQRVLAYQGA